MIGNAVPVEFARRLAEQIRRDVRVQPKSARNRKGAVRAFEELTSAEQ